MTTEAEIRERADKAIEQFSTGVNLIVSAQTLARLLSDETCASPREPIPPETETVEADLREAREIAAKAFEDWPSGLSSAPAQIRAGERDYWPAVQSALAALRSRPKAEAEPIWKIEQARAIIQKQMIDMYPDSCERVEGFRSGLAFAIERIDALHDPSQEPTSPPAPPQPKQDEDEWRAKVRAEFDRVSVVEHNEMLEAEFVEFVAAFGIRCHNEALERAKEAYLAVIRKQTWEDRELLDRLDSLKALKVREAK